MLKDNSEEILDRLKEVLDVRSNGQLANYLGISRQIIGAARKREDVPTGWIYKVAQMTGCSMDWLSFGKGPKMRVDYITEGRQSSGGVAAVQFPYGSEGEPKSRRAGDLESDAEGFSFGTAVEMLARIYSSGDRRLIHIMNTSIRTICETIESRQREQRSARELKDLKKRLMALEKEKPPQK